MPPCCNSQTPQNQLGIQGLVETLTLPFPSGKSLVICVKPEFAETLRCAETALMASRYAFPKAVKELRFHLCQTTHASQGLRYPFSVQLSLQRTFLQKSYPVIKKHNPSVPVLIREAFGVPARVYVRYGISSCCDGD